MMQKDVQINRLISALKERTKELNCLYQIEELLKDYTQDIEQVFKGIIEVIPQGWQHPELCKARIAVGEKSYVSPNFVDTVWKLTAYITEHGNKIGTLEICYIQEIPREEEGPFLKEEAKLIITIARRLGDFIQHQALRKVIDSIQSADEEHESRKLDQWRIVVDLLWQTDRDLYLSITRKMLNYLCWNGITEANAILRRITFEHGADVEELARGDNRPRQKKDSTELLSLSDKILDVAERNLPGEEILSLVQKWMHADRASFLIKALVNMGSTLGDIANAVRRFVHLSADGIELSESSMKGVWVALLSRFISDQLDYIKIAKNFVEIADFDFLIKRLIFPVSSRGQVGGKGAGLFLAWLVIRKLGAEDPDLSRIKFPKTWYLTSDGLHSYMEYNDLEEITEQKYKDIGQVRQEYPHIIQLFKNSQFSPEIIQGLSMALDDLGDQPIIVRSSSLLEDRFGATFSGKYKSLFLANQGKKKQRLQALLDAIAEVYSSTFGPDPIEYRAERGLLDFNEEMGIILQEVVGSRIGRYFLPAFAGVAFGRNEFRWSPRIKREDGLIRLVPGLGTRAVDRLSDDYPILVAPGQPGLRVNVSPNEIVHYSPNKMDVINLETNCFETIDVQAFLLQHGNELPLVRQLVSVVEGDHIHSPSSLPLDFKRDRTVITFEGLIAQSPFILQAHKILKVMQNVLGKPVDIEFASDGKDLYLLQCRIQGSSPDSAPATIPRDIPEDSILFTANRYISNGILSNITHVVYVDPQRYGELEERAALLDVGRAVSRLNALLPRRRFILMGPGRWGSRGDIQLGVNVTYSDINNTAALIEIGRKKGNYIPDLSFGTHFFQDLVEASIRYLPLYPDEKSVIFNEPFLTNSPNLLLDWLPEFHHLSRVVRVIDVPATTGGKLLKILMNAELDEALAVLEPSGERALDSAGSSPSTTPVTALPRP
jgi:hypothetical protein